MSDAALAEHVLQVEAAFPGYEVVAEELIAEKDLVAVCATFVGVHRGPFADIPPTGQSVSMPFMIIYPVADDRRRWRTRRKAARVRGCPDARTAA